MNENLFFDTMLNMAVLTQFWNKIIYFLWPTDSARTLGVQRRRSSGRVPRLRRS